MAMQRLGPSGGRSRADLEVTGGGKGKLIYNGITLVWIFLGNLGGSGEWRRQVLHGQGGLRKISLLVRGRTGGEHISWARRWS